MSATQMGKALREAGHHADYVGKGKASKKGNNPSGVRVRQGKDSTGTLIPGTLVLVHEGPKVDRKVILGFFRSQGYTISVENGKVILTGSGSSGKAAPKVSEWEGLI